MCRIKSLVRSSFCFFVHKLRGKLYPTHTFNESQPSDFNMTKTGMISMCKYVHVLLSTYELVTYLPDIFKKVISFLSD